MRYLATLLILTVLTQPCLADLVALKDGTKLEGVVANARDIRAGRTPTGRISILVGEQLHRIALEEIDYIALGEGPGMVVIDPNLEAAPVPPGPERLDTRSRYEERRKELEQRRTGGIIQTVLGLGMVGVGLLVKFGNEKVEISSSGIEYHENSYDVLNYALMVGGGALTVFGIAAVGSAKSELEILEWARPPDRPAVSLAWGF